MEKYCITIIIWEKSEKCECTNDTSDDENTVIDILDEIYSKHSFLFYSQSHFFAHLTLREVIFSFTQPLIEIVRLYCT
jgi:hypothetical protein